MRQKESAHIVFASQRYHIAIDEHLQNLYMAHVSRDKGSRVITVMCLRTVHIGVGVKIGLPLV